MDSKQTLVAFGGLTLVGFHFWFGKQKGALSPLWGGTDPNAGVPKGVAQLLLPPSVLGLPSNAPSSTNGAPDWLTAVTTPGSAVANPAPVIAPTQKPTTLPYGPLSAGRM